MLLRILRRVGASRRDDDGAVMAIVLGLILVGALISVLIMSSVIAALGNTTATRASVQAQAAAEAGIDYARAQMDDGSACAAVGGVFTLADPAFAASVSWRNNDAEAWTPGCPPATATQLRILSIGDAASPGVAGNTWGDHAQMEAVFYNDVENPSGAAIYVYGASSSSSFNAFNLSHEGALPASIYVANGNLNCTTNSTISGSVLLENGNADLTNTCTIKGDVHVSGSVKITSNVHIEGDLIASGGGIQITNSTVLVDGDVYANGNVVLHGQVGGSLQATGTVTAYATARINGGLWSGGKIEMRGRVDGGVISSSTSNMSFYAGSLVGGAVTVAGGLTVDGGIAPYPTCTSGSANDRAACTLNARGVVVGAILHSQTGLAAPVARAAPVVPDWVDWSYSWPDWQARGYTQLTWPTSDCQIGSWNQSIPFAMAMKNITTKTVVNALGCNEAYFNSLGTLTFGADVVFVGNKFTLQSTSLGSKDATEHRVRFLIPDGAPTTAGPQCSGSSGNFSTNGTVQVSTKIAALVYTPCTIAVNNGTQWRGQFYSKSITMSSGDGLSYVPVGIPGSDLEEPDAAAAPAGGFDLDAPSIVRNVSP